MSGCEPTPGGDPRYCINTDSGYSPILQELDGRVTGLERDVKHITSALDNFIVDSRTRDESLRHEVVEAASRTRPTTQSVIMGLIAIVAALATWSGLLVGGIWTMDTMSIEPLKRDIAYINAQLVTHEDDNHPHTVLAEVASLRAKVESNEAVTMNKLVSLEKELNEQIFLINSDRWTRTNHRDWERTRDKINDEISNQISVMRERIISSENKNDEFLAELVKMERELSSAMVRKDELQMLINTIERERYNASQN